jgi:tRNA/tmRNA/rRNA uracil-C5-methylase (TrmA/RlmC/RlmD family)
MIKRPTWLMNNHARKFWHDHLEHFVESGIVTEQTADTFALLCEVWGEMRAADKSESKGRIYYIALLKQWQSMLRQFTKGEKVDDIDTILKELDA